MDDTAEKQPRSRIVAYVVMIAVLLPLVYILSVGPAIFLVIKFPSLGRPATTIYQPLIWLNNKNTLLKQPLEKYEEFWVALASRL
jgi:hypothetical protein